jgi:hypothetical protein
MISPIRKFLHNVKKILHFKKIRENDLVSSKFFDMIYADYEANKNLGKAKIYFDNWIKLKYLISVNSLSIIDKTYEHPDDKTIEIVFILDIQKKDITEAKIDVEIFKENKGNFKIVSRRKDNKKLIYDENGIEMDRKLLYPYIDISSDKVIEIIEFFKNEFIKKYPDLKENTRVYHVKY